VDNNLFSSIKIHFFPLFINRIINALKRFQSGASALEISPAPFENISRNEKPIPVRCERRRAATNKQFIGDNQPDAQSRRRRLSAFGIVFRQEKNFGAAFRAPV
jgi:hypothetical protein